MSVAPRCYVASDLGFSEAGRLYYSRELLPALSRYVEPVDPWALIPAEVVANAAAQGREAEMTRTIGLANVEAIDSCRLLVAVLNGQEVDSGVASEIGYASAKSVRCLGMRTDLRQAGEPGAIVSLQVETFIGLSGGEIVGSLEELVDALGEAAQDLRSVTGSAVTDARISDSVGSEDRS